MRCPMARTLLNEYLQNTLNPTTKTELEEHLAGCSDCSRLLEEQRKIWSANTDTDQKLEKSSSTADERDTVQRISPSAPRASGAGFEPQPHRAVHRDAQAVRHRLEEMGVLFPEPETSKSLTPMEVEAAQDLPDDDPLQQLWQRFRGADSSPVSMPLPYARSDSGDETHNSSAFVPMRDGDSGQQRTMRVTESKKESGEERKQENREESKSLANEDDSLDKSDDNQWVDIVITHHVTRKQLRKRVRRDSLEAQRYLQENPDARSLYSESLEGAQHQKSPPSVSDKSERHISQEHELKAASETDEIVIPEFLQPETQKTEPEFFGLVQEQVRDLARDAVMRLPDQDPEQARVVVVAPDQSENIEVANGLANEAAAISINEIEDDTDERVEGLRESSTKVTDSWQATVPLCAERSNETSARAESGASTAYETQDADDDEAEDEIVGESLYAATHASQRMPPPQSNPIVSRPAEIGRERLERQSRFARDEQKVIVRDTAATALPSHAFTRMRWLENLRRRPVQLLVIIAVLLVLLIFLFGMLTSMFNSPGALAKKEMIQAANDKLAADIEIMEQWAESFLVDPQPSAVAIKLAAFDLTSVSDETRLYTQLTGFNALYDALLCFPTEIYSHEYRDIVRSEDARAVGERLCDRLNELCIRLKADVGKYPLSEADWQRTQEHIEPVVTLALCYEKTGGFEEVEPGPAIQNESTLRRRIEDILSDLVLSEIRLQRVISKRDASDRWWADCYTADWPHESGYRVKLNDNDASFVSLELLQPNSETGYVAPRHLETVEAFLRHLYNDGSMFVTLGQVRDFEQHDEIWLAPVRENTVYPEAPIVMRVQQNGILAEVKREIWQMELSGVAQEMSDPSFDLFDAAGRARQYLASENNVFTQETLLLADLSLGMIGEPRRSWFYRAKLGDDWHAVIVEEDRIVPFHEYCLIRSLEPLKH